MRHSEYFQNRECEYFPCHPGADPEDFNCLFCYCPLYALGSRCGGNCRWTPEGLKDCSGCLFPHRRANYALVLSRYGELAELIRKTGETPRPGEGDSERFSGAQT